MAKDLKRKRNASTKPPIVDDNDTLVLSIKDIGRIDIKEGVELDRIHPRQYGSTQFNRGGAGNARFSPIHNEKGDVIATIYAATSLEAAAMETAFHDVPIEPGIKNVVTDTIEHLVHSKITLTADLVVGDLTGLGLRRIGLKHAEIIGSDPNGYPHSRRIAEEIHKQHDDLHGIAWISKQHGSETAYVFFEDRIADGTLKAIGDPAPLLKGETLGKVLDLAERINVNLVPGDSVGSPAELKADEPPATERRRKRGTGKKA